MSFQMKLFSLLKVPCVEDMDIEIKDHDDTSSRVELLSQQPTSVTTNENSLSQHTTRSSNYSRTANSIYNGTSQMRTKHLKVVTRQDLVAGLI